MYDTEYENGVLICHIHKIPISKSHGRFFCLKCLRNAGKRATNHKYQVGDEVKIYNKPMTKEDFEGDATIRKVIQHTDNYYEVQFHNDGLGEKYWRFIY